MGSESKMAVDHGVCLASCVWAHLGFSSSSGHDFSDDEAAATSPGVVLELTVARLDFVQSGEGRGDGLSE